MLPLAWKICMALATIAAAADDSIISNWNAPRVNIIRDTIYINGGNRQISSALTGSGQSGNFSLEATYLTFNLSQKFDNLTNFLTILDSHDALSANALPDYVGGAMFANDYEFILYSGSLTPTSGAKLPDAQSIVVHQQYARGNTQLSNVPGTAEVTLPDNITRYVVGGADASAPSESLGFYFSGMHRRDWNDTDGKGSPEVSQQLIVADLSQKDNADNWKNETIPDNIPGRPGAALVWVPVSDQGMLVVVGGSSDLVDLHPDFSDPKVDVKAASRYMKTVSLYDVKTNKWFQQNTTGDIPPITASFCAVSVADEENSIHNIYIYGGYNGTDLEATGNDDVYVLTLPRFEWVQLYKGDSSNYGRFNHRCVVPDPSRMISIGGMHDFEDSTVPQIFRTFDLNEGKFVDEYDPSTWKNYSMPESVAKVNNLSKKRATNEVQPAKGWSSPELEKHWNTKYPNKIQQWYPYTSNTPNTPNPPNAPVESEKKHKHLPKWVPPFLGVVCGLIAIAIIVAAFLLVRRRRRQRREKARIQALQEAAELQKSSLRYDMVDENGVPIYAGYPGGSHSDAYDAPAPVEIDGYAIHELADTAVPAELPADNPKMAPVITKDGSKAAFSKSRSFDDMQASAASKKDTSETRSMNPGRNPYGGDDSQDERRSI